MRAYQIIAICMFAAGCSTSDITSSWHSNEDMPAEFKKIVVMGLINTKDRALHEKMEGHIVDDLAALGYDAESSMRTYGPKYFEGLDEKAALAKLKSNHIDAVLTIVLLNREREKHYVAGRIHYSPYGIYQSHFWHYQGVVYHRIAEPGYYVENTVYFWESNLYRMSDQKLIYSAQSKSFDPDSPESLAHEYGRLIIRDMVQEAVLKPKKIK